ncbi:AAA family ATPase [Sphingobacterium siyangense]|jgi:putative nucleotidyltransferase with HDIG domain|uniref:AAA family ATPase n=1 Tax=Sphingobacterium siyangense TaxID=459529 RepID=UPI0028AA2EA3|nr:AAA family ATPase [Sphingobacterium siyangense]
MAKNKNDLGKEGFLMEWTIAVNKNWSALEEQFSWVRDMEQVQQDPLHHAEGNVAIHTQMVLQQLEALPGYRNLDYQKQELLWASALLHDVEKRSTTIVAADGRISSPNHAKRGAQTAREILFRDVETPFALREEIVALVRYHGLPLWLMEKVDPMKSALEASLSVNMGQLKLLAEADAKGRYCADLDALLYALDMFELYSKEIGCWDATRSFLSENARFTYFNGNNSYVDYVPFDTFKSTVTVLSGLAGMGKDYQILAMNTDLPVISLDDIRRKYRIDPTDKKRNGWVVQEAKEQAKKYLRCGQDFIWNATNITSQMRKQLIDLFVSYQAYVKLLYVEKPYKIWRAQNSDREYPLPEVVLDKMFHNLEVPQLTEAHEVHYITE